MFERFPAESVRALFAARAVAHKAGRDSIEVLHLVAGLVLTLRERTPQSASAPDLVHQIVIDGLRVEPVTDVEFGDPPEIPFSHSVHRVLNSAVGLADRLGHHRIRPEHLLLAVFEEPSIDEPSHEAAQALELAGLNRMTLSDAAARGAAGDDSPLQYVAHLRIGVSPLE